MEKVDYIILYGCHIKKVMNKRLDYLLKIIDNYDYNKIVLTGGVGLFGKYNEALYMKDYLVKNNIDLDKLILEDKSRTTKENNINVINLLDLNNINKETKIVLVTNKNHMNRNKKILNKLLNNKKIYFIYESI
jgi:uncharacterized SAM-binding protein YcdF (DUF218 family)